MESEGVVIKNVYADHGYGFGGYGYNGNTGSDYGIAHQLSDISSKVDTNAVLGGLGNIITGQHGISSEIFGSTRDVLGSVANVKDSLTGQNFTTLQSLNQATRDIIQKSTTSDFQNLNSFNNTNSSVMSGFINSNDRQQNATNLIISQGRDLAAQIAECCCEIKSLVRDDGQTTRLLITDTRMHALEEKLAESRLQASQAMQTAALIDALSKGK